MLNINVEDRVIANLSEDPNKLNIFLRNVDGHSQATCLYWPKAVEKLIGPTSDITEAAIKFKQLVDDGDKTAKDLRSRSKGISFGLAYGAFPKKVSNAAKMPIEEATEIFNAYHTKLFPKITEYREKYVLASAKEQGYIHLGLGFRLYTDDADKDIRTLNNGTCQFWSILTALTINKLHQLIDEAGLQEDVQVTSTIYDSIYFIIKDDAETIKWLNDRIIPIMEQDFMENQILSNSADLEIGPSWAELHVLPHNADIETISEVRSKW